MTFTTIGINRILNPHALNLSSKASAYIVKFTYSGHVFSKLAKTSNQLMILRYKFIVFKKMQFLTTVLSMTNTSDAYSKRVLLFDALFFTTLLFLMFLTNE